MASEKLVPASDEGENAPRPERKFVLWAAILFATNVVCLLMLAARAASPANMRGFFDVAIFACLIGVASFAVIRLMFLYPYRLLDLLTMVIVLAGGMRGALAAAQAILRLQCLVSPTALYAESSEYVLFAQSCMVSACVLMGGAALGLRHCRLLRIESPTKRAVALVFGMTAVPALFGVVAIPIYLLKKFLTEQHTSEESLGWIVALIFSFVATLTNAAFSIKALALNTQNSARESKWRQPGIKP